MENIDFFMLGVICGIGLLLLVNKAIEWYWKKEMKKIENELERTNREHMKYQNFIQIRFSPPLPPDNSIEAQLKKALEDEDYEKAAKLRDQLKKKK